MKLTSEVLDLRTRHPFHIARAVGPMVRRNVWVRVRIGATEGWGEAAPNPYYGETADTVHSVLRQYADAIPDSDDPSGLALEAVEREMQSILGRNAAARAGVSAALHDLVGKAIGQPVWRLLGLEPMAPPSSFTIGIDTTDRMVEKVAEAAGYPILKVKLGTERDEEILTAIREAAPDKPIRVDANTGWTAKDALARVALLEEMNVELVEQPFKADDLDAFRVFRDKTQIPVIADESCLVAADVPRLAGLVDGVNIKLAKCGSLREGVRLAAVARAHRMGVMLGCMMESTLGIAAAVQLAPLADWVDLDGAALLASDPFDGPGLDAVGNVRFNDKPGLGVSKPA